ncbi:hypothetical protein DENSPDRAFT_522971 [Dentipellis sp. KUC8613]|nr:hypothetical protein DENSPDRAFT_522971 [Dentipellis sp. KUC8613]
MFRTRRLDTLVVRSYPDMSFPNALTGLSASEISWSDESTGSFTVRSHYVSVREGRVLSPIYFGDVMTLSLGIPLNQWGLPAHSYRYHTLRMAQREIEITISKIRQDFSDGILKFDQWRVLKKHWADKERALSKQLEEETQTGPQTLEEVLQSWGYTEEQAALIVSRNSDIRCENLTKSYHHLFERNVRKG